MSTTSLVDCFSVSRDPRQESKIDHELIDILVLCVFGVICGAEGWQLINAVPTPEEHSSDPLTDLLRSGAKDLIKQPVEAELASMLSEYKDHTLPDGRQAVVRNGYLPKRTLAYCQKTGEQYKKESEFVTILDV